MKKSNIFGGLLALAAISAAMTSCKYDDGDLWQSVGDLDGRVSSLEEKARTANTEIEALRTIVNALGSKLTVTSVTPSADGGYRIEFSDGQTVTIADGKDGAAPDISVSKGDDGLYYWTLAGEPLKDAGGNPVCANGIKGDTGEAAVAPQVRISPSTKEWEISVDGGKVWTATGVNAEGQSKSPIFSSVDVAVPGEVTFVLADGSEVKVPRYDASAPLFEINAGGVQEFFAGETRSFRVNAANVADHSIAKPDGWTARYESGVLSVTAPAEGNTYAETAGSVAVNIVSAAGRSLIARLEVRRVAGEMRVLTFEDADARFDAYPLDYCGRTITKWSDLVDSKQYGGPMLYGTGYGMEEPYYWYDQNNTELMHVMPEAYGSYCYWGGGHAVSSYFDSDISHGDFMHQLSVYNATGGHNGSKNFVMHYGYRDDSSYKADAMLPSLMFGDGKERVIDHMYVMWSTYLANSVFNGNGLSQQLGPDGYVKVVAVGYDSADVMTGKAELFIAGASGNITDWTRWDLSGLGAVSKVQFNICGDSDNGYGFSQPAYFAYDDVAVRFTE